MPDDPEIINCILRHFRFKLSTYPLFMLSPSEMLDHQYRIGNILTISTSSQMELLGDYVQEIGQGTHRTNNIIQRFCIG